MWRVLVLVLLWLPLAAGAQEDDRGWLTGRLETLLSDSGRSVRIEGFAGALSSRATFERLIIADDAGPWLTLSGGAIQWNRAALLSGRIEIEELSAAAIEMPRLPQPAPAPGPRAEARPFALPVLPVSVRIGRIGAERVTLGEPVLGQAVTLALDGGLVLEAGSGGARLTVRRTDDGPAGRLSLDAGYEAGTRRIRIDLLADEGPGGIAATLLGLPGTPAATLAIAGSGPVDDLATDIALSTEGQRRLTGGVRLSTAEGAQRVSARLSGDIAPLLAPDLRPFFGAGVELDAEGRRGADGRIDLSRLSVATAGLTLEGALALAPGGWPERFALDIGVGGAAGPTRLPLPAQVTLRSASLRLDYDRAEREGWRLRADLAGLAHPDLALGALRIEGSGRIARDPGGAAAPTIGGRIRAVAGGLDWADPALAEALGRFATLRTGFHWHAGAPLSLHGFELVARDLAAKGRVDIAVEGTEIALSGEAGATARNLGRYAALAGRPLAGGVEGTLSGRYALLSGEGDIEARLAGTDLALGDARLDRALAGASEITLSLRRDTTGTEVRRLAVAAGPLSARASGRVATGAADLVAEARLSDLGQLDPAWRGAAAMTAFWRLGAGTGRLTVAADARGLALGQPDLDRLVAGDSRIELAVTGPSGDLWLDAARLDSPALSMTLAGEGTAGARRVTGQARLSDLALIVPGFPGPLTLSGGATETGEGFTLDLAGAGPGGTEARATGSVTGGGERLDLALRGRAQAALANPFLLPQSVSGPVTFDLRLAGPPALSALSGTVQIEGGRFAAPAANLALEGIRATARISAARAAIEARAAVAGGGTVAVAGNLGLAATAPAELSVMLDNAAVTEPELFRATVSGRLSVTGPLAGGAKVAGALTIPGAEIRVPEALPGGAGLLPGLAHRGATPPVRATLDRAGLLGEGGNGNGNGSGPAYGLDVSLDAPRRIFVRGRGLEAELGGRLVLGGTTADTTATGRFDLIRGRLDLLGKRFTLDRGTIGLQGALDPFLSFAATTSGGDIAATILIEGPASAPEVTFASVPALPQEEVVARLLFGQSVANLSALQAAQLAGAVASLAGFGGEGLVSRIRRGFGLDDLDVATAGDGTTELRFGKYLSENLYTDVTLGSDGRSRIDLNLDLRPGLTARGSVGSDGGTGVGLFYQRDY